MELQHRSRKKSSKKPQYIQHPLSFAELDFQVVSAENASTEGEPNRIALVCRLADRNFKLYIQLKNRDMSNFFNLWLYVEGSTGHPILNILTHKRGRIHSFVVVN